MVNRKAAFLAPLAIVAAALPGIWMGSASATRTSNGGAVTLFQVDTTLSGNTGQVVMTGALAGYGTDTEGTGEGGNINVFTFGDGGFSVDITNFGISGNHLDVKPNCSFTNVVYGVNLPVVAGSGTGIYAGISGSFDATATYAGVIPPLSHGKGCDLSQLDSTPTIDWITGNGSVSLPR